MKKHLLFILSFAAASGFSQSVPNGGFESWQVSTFENPTGYESANYENKNNFSSGNCVTKTPDAFHGSYGVRLTTVQTGTTASFAWVANGNPGGNGNSGGLPYNQKPSGIRLRYKSNIIGTDSAIVLCWFKKQGAYIGQYIFKISSTQNNYTLMDATFSPSLTQYPDTVIFAAASSNAFLNTGFQTGNFLQLDSVTFKGVAFQPAGLNGDFENWTPHTDYKLNGWNAYGLIQRANDAYSGNYALEMQSTSPGFGDNNYNSSIASTGAPSQSTTLGGYPYSLQNDTLVLYYKYLPADPSDSARIYLNFKKNGVYFSAAWRDLSFAASYTQKKVPINLSQIPDSMVINIQTSKYPMLPSYAGSDLKIDNIYLKSQMLPVSNFTMPAVGCLGQPIQLQDASFNMPNAWGWIMPGGSPGSSTQQNPTVIYNSIGTKTITMVSNNQFGAGTPISKTISINPLPSVYASSTVKPCGGTGNAVLTATGAISYTWSNGATTSSINVNPSVTTIYTVVGTTNGCSNAATGSVVIPTAPRPDICMVTVDSLTQNNEIYWDKMAYPMLDSMIVYREVITNTYKRIGAVSKSALSYFTDTSRSVGPANGDPNISTYRYKLQVRDTCGNYGPMSLWHNTVFFTHTGSTFFWTNNYLIEGPVNPVISYSLLVCQNPTVNPAYQLVGTTTGNQNQLNDPYYSIYQNTADWRVEAYLGYSCLASKALTQGQSSSQVSRSNISNNRVIHNIGIKTNSLMRGLKVYPNPASRMVYVQFESAGPDSEVSMYNTLGEKVYSGVVQNSGSIDVSGFSKGIYSLTVKSDKGKAIYKIIVE
jgi:hypothetical protein